MSCLCQKKLAHLTYLAFTVTFTLVLKFQTKIPWHAVFDALTFFQTGNRFQNTNTDQSRTQVWTASEEDFCTERRRHFCVGSIQQPIKKQCEYICEPKKKKKIIDPLTLSDRCYFPPSISLSLRNQNRNFRPEIQDHPLTARLRRQRSENDH